MKLIFCLLLLPLSAVSKDQPYGTWRFATTQVYIVVAENGQAYQCRIDRNLSVISAHGIYDGDKTISWEPTTVVDVEGNVIEREFSWQQDEVKVDNETMNLTGPYGSFDYVATNKPLPKPCR